VTVASCGFVHSALLTHLYIRFRTSGRRHVLGRSQVPSGIFALTPGLISLSLMLLRFLTRVLERFFTKMSTSPNQSLQATPTNASVSSLKLWVGLWHRCGVPELYR
jgi:hypothetical protein